MIDAVSDGSLNNNTFEVAQELIEKMIMNNYQWQLSQTRPSKPVGIHNIDVVTTLVVQVEALSKKINGLLVANQLAHVM